MERNANRVKRIAKAMKACTQYDWKSEKDDAVIDLLADLRHFCDAKGFDFANCDRIAHEHYSLER